MSAYHRRLRSRSRHDGLHTARRRWTLTTVCLYGVYDHGTTAARGVASRRHRWRRCGLRLRHVGVYRWRLNDGERGGGVATVRCTSGYGGFGDHTAPLHGTRRPLAARHSYGGAATAVDSCWRRLRWHDGCLPTVHDGRRRHGHGVDGYDGRRRSTIRLLNTALRRRHGRRRPDGGVRRLRVANGVTATAYGAAVAYGGRRRALRRRANGDMVLQHERRLSEWW